MKDCNVNTMWIQEEEELEGWSTKPEQVEELMIGDTEYEVRSKSPDGRAFANYFSLSSGETALRHLTDQRLRPLSIKTSNGEQSFVRCTRWWQIVPRLAN